MPVPQMSFAPPTDSPSRSRSYATFVTDLELQQARAEMEECYRRRARRVSLEDTPPVGRPMTDEEIEDLQWQLGDFGPANGYGSRGRKRSQQDVIDMTIEEMEAELQETTEAIRKRRRRTPGLMLKPLWMLTVIACLAGGPVEAFTAYDCTWRPTRSWSRMHAPTQAGMGRWRPPSSGKSSRSSRIG